jgi:ABC-type transporter Mla MlaB component
MFAIRGESASGLLMVAGDLTQATVGELDRVLRGAPSGVQLDLRELRQVDSSGTDCLRRWQDAGVRMRHMSPRVSLLLRPETPR